MEERTYRITFGNILEHSSPRLSVAFGHERGVAAFHILPGKGASRNISYHQVWGEVHPQSQSKYWIRQQLGEYGTSADYFGWRVRFKASYAFALVGLRLFGGSSQVGVFSPVSSRGAVRVALWVGAAAASDFEGVPLWLPAGRARMEDLGLADSSANLLCHSISREFTSQQVSYSSHQN